jgi:hypothetical protein
MGHNLPDDGVPLLVADMLAHVGDNALQAP